MKRNIAIRLFFLLCGVVPLIAACSSNSDDGDNTNSGNDQITTLANLKALFDKGLIGVQII